MKKKININSLKSSPPVRDKLSPELEEWARRIYTSLGSELVGTFEQFEFNFCKDLHPLKELFIWQTIATSLELWEKGKCLISPYRLEIFKYLLSFSVGADVPETQQTIELKKLMETVQKGLLKQLNPNS